MAHRFMLGLVLATLLSACGTVAAPFRATAEVVKGIPLAGSVLATPFSAVGDIID
ncbi:MAG: phosphoribosylglycinamide formyltransferase [Rhodospirillales bacterium]|nr:phosphoribosylglycinamide formyltransferase [Rhodospirillales bacterium]